jgi:DNA mismatch repair protein MutS
VQFNRVHGFYIEVTQGQLDKVPVDYRRRQTLKNAERFITPELKAFEDKALSAQRARAGAREALYEQLLDELQCAHRALQAMARALASSTRCARWPNAPTLGWCAPQFTAEPASRSTRAAIRWSRPGRDHRRQLHPQRHALGPRAHAAHHRPEHGRQVDLHAAGGADRLLAHGLASCRRRRPPRADRPIFTRIGAADDLAGGRSTFMVEMTEAARSCTAPRRKPGADGRDRPRHLDLRRPGAGLRHRRHLHDKTQAFTLFATHYFELTVDLALHPRICSPQRGARRAVQTQENCRRSP